MIAVLLASVACAVSGQGFMVAPDNTCTPGATAHLNRAQTCTPKDRPSTPAAVRRKVLGQYGVPGWTGKDGEIDHRIPFFLGGETVEDNLWPERGPIPNAKDRLESYAYQRVCVKRTMRPRAARRMFWRDWRHYYRKFGLG